MLKQTIQFVLPFLLILIGCSIINKFIHDKIYSDENISFNKNSSTIICGSSRLQVINPNNIENCENISSGGQPYFLTYYALKKALSVNPQIKNIVLSSSYENFIWHCNNNPVYYQKDIIRPYIDIIDFKEFQHFGYLKPTYWEILLKKIYVPLLLENNIKLILKFKFSHLDANNINYYGQFYSSKKSWLSKQYLHNYINKISYYHHSEWNEKWYFEILKMCKEKQLNVLVVAAPLHPDLFEKLPKKFLGNFDRIITRSKDNFTNLKFINYTNDVFPDSCYGDWEHLNSYGTPKIEKKINTELANLKN